MDAAPRDEAGPGTRPAAAGRGPALAVYLMFFCSGLASLICEVVWFKQLQFVVGSSTYSMSVVVACFFGGLALGSWLVGRRADRWRRPLLAYALLELALAAVSAAVTLALWSWATWVEWLAPWLGPDSAIARPLIFLIAFLLLIVPASLMGATLPALAKHLVRERSELGKRIGALYGVNTLGGAAGCFLVGFLLIGWLGVVQAGLVASALYAGIAAMALMLSLRTVAFPAEEPDAVDASPLDRLTPAALEAPAVSPRLLIGAFAVMGFTSIAYEVLWFRLLTHFGVHTVYAFSGMLGVYLLGLVTGSFLGPRLASTPNERYLLLARTQALLALAALCSLALLGRSRQLLDGFAALNLVGLPAFFVVCLLVLLIPTTLIGISLPLVADLATRRLAGVSSRLGSLYSLNTVGGILGSLLTGFVLLPFLGSQWTFLLMVAINLCLFAWLTAADPALRAKRDLRREGLLVGAAVVAGALWLGPNYLKDALTDFPGATILEFREGPDATFVVIEYPLPTGELAQQLFVNGMSYANNSPFGRRYMGTLGHLPTLLHPNPKSSLVICIGTGTTVGSLTLHPSMEEVWAVDIARTVFDVAPRFVPLNNRFFTSPKVRQVVSDGRHFLLCAERQYDVLTFEPPPPQEAGVVNLYSREFYQLAKRRMKPGAILCQWIPMELDREVLGRMMLKTLRAEFPHVSLWVPNNKEGVAIASLEPVEIDLEKLRCRLAEPRLQADLSAYGLGEAEQVAATFMAAGPALDRYLADAPIVTDNQPGLEYYSFYPYLPMRFDQLLPFRQPVESALAHPPADPEKLKRAAAVAGHIWRQYELNLDGRKAEAQHELDAALKLDPGNRYLLYLKAQSEKG